MKKTISVLALLASLVLIGLNTSCTKTKTKEYEKLIVGRWQVNNARTQLKTDASIVWEFAPGGSFISYDDRIWSGIYVINNDNLSINFPSINDLWEFNIIHLDMDYLELDEINSDGTIGNRALLTRLPSSD